MQASPFIFSNALLAESSLRTFFISSKGGFTVSCRMEVMCAYLFCPERTTSRSVPKTSSFDGALGLLNSRGQSLTHGADRLHVLRNCEKNTSWPIGVTGA